MSRNLVVKCKARFATFVVFEYAYLPSPLLHEFPSRARYIIVVYLCLKVVYSSHWRLNFYACCSSISCFFWVPICCEKSSLGRDWKKTPTFFGKSPTFFGKSPTFLEKRPRFFEKCPTFFWGSAEHSLTISEKCSRNARGMLEVKEVFKGHKARFYDEMEQKRQ